MTQSQTNDAASSPMLGKLIENKALPDGGWRATGAKEGCLTVTFENENLARNFAMRCAEKGYSASTPLSTIGGYWNVEVNDNSQTEDKFSKNNVKDKFGFVPWTEKDKTELIALRNEVIDLRHLTSNTSTSWNEGTWMTNKILDICVTALQTQDKDLLQTIKSKIKQTKDFVKKI